jgi:uncharacterized protein (TIGR03435 family)
MRMLLAFAVPLVLHAQSTDSKPAFEVVSIKPVEPGQRPAGARPSNAGHVSYPSVNLTFLLIRAFDVKAYQIDGVDLFGMQFYSIDAKLPEGAKESEVPAMLQSMLADRFGLKYHWESKMQSAFALTVAKGGPKLKQSQPLDPAAPRKPAMSFTIGGGHLQFNRTTLASFAQAMSNFIGTPVIDSTELAGEYDIVMDINPADLQGMRGVPVLDSGPRPESDAPSLQSAMQILGLKLESRKAPIDHLVIDSVRKSPTEN